MKFILPLILPPASAVLKALRAGHSLLVLSAVVGFLIHPPQALAATSLTLSADTPQATVDNPLTVTIAITSTDNTLGTDVVLNYDPAYLRLDSVTPGTIYPNYSDVSGQTQSGTVNVSAVSDFTQGITPQGTFATISFVPIKDGTTDISVAYDSTSSALTGVTPFDSDQPNLLIEAPSPLTLTIAPASPLTAVVKSAGESKPVFLLAIPGLIVVVILVLLLRRFTSKRNTPPYIPPPPIIPPATPPPAAGPTPAPNPES